MGRTRVTGKVEPIVKKWLSKDEAKSYIGCSDDFLRTLREKALISFSQFYAETENRNPVPANHSE
jgi:hypothetical protein